MKFTITVSSAGDERGLWGMWEREFCFPRFVWFWQNVCFTVCFIFPPIWVPPHLLCCLYESLIKWPCGNALFFFFLFFFLCGSLDTYCAVCMTLFIHRSFGNVFCWLYLFINTLICIYTCIVLISIWISIYNALYIENVGKYVVIVVSSKWVSLYIFCYPYGMFYVGGIVICLCDLYMGVSVYMQRMWDNVFFNCCVI